MMNIYFPDEEITDNDLYFICYMIERVARKLHQKNKYVVNTIGRDALKHLISVANVLHCENPLQVEDDWIEEYHLQEGDYDITDVDRELAEIIPTPLEMGKVYKRLIIDTLQLGQRKFRCDGTDVILLCRIWRKGKGRIEIGRAHV